jgi:hypothetical protein
VAAHTLIHDEARRNSLRRTRRDGLLQLGWLHFWMLTGILGGMLALVAMVFLIQILIVRS